MIYIYIKRHTDSRSSCTGPYNWTWHIFFYRIFWSNLFIPLKSHVLEILLNSVKGYLTVCGIRCVCFSWVQVIFSLLVLYLFAKFYNFQATSYFQFRQKKKIRGTTLWEEKLQNQNSFKMILLEEFLSL